MTFRKKQSAKNPRTGPASAMATVTTSVPHFHSRTGSEAFGCSESLHSTRREQGEHRQDRAETASSGPAARQTPPAPTPWPPRGVDVCI